jgi:RNA recognition motif-containing protein
MGTKLYVGNLSMNATIDELKSMFSGIGAVNRVRIAMDSETGDRKGFGYVEMASQAEADAAIEGMNGQLLHEQAMKVREARSAKDSKDKRKPL